MSDVTRKLVWQANGDATQVDFSAAEAKCAAIGPNSDSWRLPKRIELVTLLDFSQSGTLINPLFKNIAIGPVWTSSESRSVATVTTQFWVVSFGDGTVTTVEGSQPAAGTLCVKAQ